jgi:hypothetical protein
MNPQIGIDLFLSYCQQAMCVTECISHEAFGITMRRFMRSSFTEQVLIVIGIIVFPGSTAGLVMYVSHELTATQVNPAGLEVVWATVYACMFGYDWISIFQVHMCV